MQDDASDRLAAALAPMLSQPADDILDVDDRVVHDVTESDDEPRQDHRVDRRAAPLEHQQCSDQRQRNGDAADQGDAPIEQEEDEDDHQQQAADEQRIGQVADRQLDEGRRAEDRGVDLYVREAWPQRVERLIDPAGHMQRVGPWELLDDEQESWTAVDDRVAGERLVILDHPGHVVKAQRLAVAFPDRDRCEILGLDDGQHGPNAEPLIRGFDKPAGPDHSAG